jgi:hypothetical protein
MQTLTHDTYTIGDVVEDFVLPTATLCASAMSPERGPWCYFTTTWCPYCHKRDQPS